MSNTLTTHTLTLDTLHRDIDTYPVTNTYRIQLGKSYNGVVAMHLEYAGIPAVEHPINASNNVLVYRVGQPGALGQRRTVTVPPGSYTPADLTTAIQAQMTTHGDGMTLTYDPSTKKVTFTASDEFHIVSRDSTMVDVLGIKTTGYMIESVDQAYTPIGIVNVSGARYIQIESPDLDDHVLGTIDIQKSPAEFIPRPERYFDTIKSKVSSIGIRLTTDGGRVYDTGCTEHVLIVKITIMDAKQLPFAQKFDAIV